MKSLIERDKKRRNLFADYELVRVKLKALSQTLTLSPEKLIQYQLQLAILPRNSSKNRIKNRCILTGRGHGVYSQFKLSRIQIRELANQGKIPGLTKSSW